MAAPGEPLSPGFTIRPAGPDDLDAILEIEHDSYAYPWPLAVFEQELKNRWSEVDVVENGSGATVAFVVYWVVHDELHLLNIAVRSEARRRGLGRALLDYLECVCERRELTYLTLEVRVGNGGAIALYETQGYRIIHRRKKYYVDEGEDALVMAKVLGPDNAT